MLKRWRLNLAQRSVSDIHTSPLHTIFNTSSGIANKSKLSEPSVAPLILKMNFFNCGEELELLTHAVFHKDLGGELQVIVCSWNVFISEDSKLRFLGRMPDLRRKAEKKPAGSSTSPPPSRTTLQVTVRWCPGRPTFIHVLGDDVDGFLWYHGIELDQFVMLQLLHDLCLLEEWFWGHCAWFESLYGYFCVSVPGTCGHSIIWSQIKESLLKGKKKFF